MQDVRLLLGHRWRFRGDVATRSSWNISGARFLIDHVGADRVVLGSDWPFVGWDPSPVGWVQGLKSLSQDEKDQILWRNLESLLKLS